MVARLPFLSHARLLSQPGKTRFAGAFAASYCHNASWLLNRLVSEVICYLHVITHTVSDILFDCDTCHISSLRRSLAYEQLDAAEWILHITHINIDIS